MKLFPLLTFLIILTLMMPLTLAHDDEKINPKEYTNSNSISPIYYFSQGDIGLGIITLGLWCIILWGIYTLALLLLGRLIINNK